MHKKIFAAALSALLVGSFAIVPAFAATTFHDAAHFFPASGNVSPQWLLGFQAANDYSIGYYSSLDTVRLFSSDVSKSLLEQVNGSNENGYSLQGGVVYDPANKNLVYFGTTKDGAYLTDGSHTKTFRLNSYNFRTQKMTVLLTKTISVPQDNPYDYVLRGIDGTNLVFEGMTDNSPGPCANSWNSGDAFYAFHLRRPQMGLTRYMVPQYLIIKGDKAAKACEAEMAQ